MALITRFDLFRLTDQQWEDVTKKLVAKKIKPVTKKIALVTQQIVEITRLPNCLAPIILAYLGPHLLPRAEAQTALWYMQQEQESTSMGVLKRLWSFKKIERPLVAQVFGRFSPSRLLQICTRLGLPGDPLRAYLSLPLKTLTRTEAQLLRIAGDDQEKPIPMLKFTDMTLSKFRFKQKATSGSEEEYVESVACLVFDPSFNRATIKVMTSSCDYFRDCEPYSLTLTPRAYEEDPDAYKDGQWEVFSYRREGTQIFTCWSNMKVRGAYINFGTNPEDGWTRGKVWDNGRIF